MNNRTLSLLLIGIAATGCGNGGKVSSPPPSSAAQTQNAPRTDSDITIAAASVKQEDEGVLATSKKRGGTIRTLKFAKGKTATVVRDTVSNTAPNVYILSARASQTLSVKIVNNRKRGDSLKEPNTDAGLTIYRPSDESPLKDEGGTHWTGRLAESGDYLIEIVGSRGSTEYTLYVRVE